MLTFDANVLFYAVDHRDERKQNRSAGILRSAADHEDCFITIQALGEFAHAVVRQAVLSRSVAAQTAQDWALIFEPIAATPAAFETALTWWRQERLSYWDAMLVATVADAGATALVSEDLQDGASWAGVEVINPFAMDADDRLRSHGLPLR